MKDFTNVYIKKIPDETIFHDVYPYERTQYINSSSNMKLKTQRYWVWKLLEEAALRSFCIGFENINFTVRNGIWSCDEFYFSLSHTDGAVAVAVSNARCGIDIENLSKRSEKINDINHLVKKICTGNEISKIHSVNDLISLWTKKECIFKTLEDQSVAFSAIENENYTCETHNIKFTDDYIFSVYCNIPDNIHINII